MFAAIVKLLDKTQGRDKLTKMLIYIFKLIDAIKTIWTKNPTFRFERLGSHFQKARQIMRLGKGIAQYQSVIKLIQQDTNDEFGRLIRIVCHSFFAFYWVLDNLSLMSEFGLIDTPLYQVQQSAMTIKFIGLSVAAILNLRSWIRLHHSQLMARRALKYLKGEENLTKNRQLNSLIKQQFKMFLLCVKIYGDMLPSMAKSTIAKKMFDLQIPRLAQALGGLINALVTCILVLY